MEIKVRDLRQLSVDDLGRYIVELKIQHDQAVSQTHVHGIEACRDRIREIEEELCWAEHEAGRRSILYPSSAVVSTAVRR